MTASAKSCISCESCLYPASHRLKIAFGLAFLVTALGVLAFRSPLFSPTVSLAFTGYSEDGRFALFSVTNHTSNYIEHELLQIQILGVRGWTNYNDIEMWPIHSTLGSQQARNLWEKLPEGKLQWRALVHYSIKTGYESRWQIWYKRLLNSAHIRTRPQVLIAITKEYER